MAQEFPRGEAPRLQRVIEIFHRTLGAAYGCRLEGGAEEPIYLPASGPGEDHRIVFTRDYIASALHEVAHWCIAGAERRRRVDYGYWYVPDGRDKAAQAAFEKAEVKPQALERIFCRACDEPFRVSADNLLGGNQPRAEFRAAIQAQTVAYCNTLSTRAGAFAFALARAFGQPNPTLPCAYTIDQL